MTPTDKSGKEHVRLAFNEVSVIRSSGQSANLQIEVDEVEVMEKLTSDGLIICTPAGSTAYNLSAHGSIIPIGSYLIGVTPVSPFRPIRWRGALLPDDVLVTVNNLDVNKRPLSATADSIEITDVVKVKVELDKTLSQIVLFDKKIGLDIKILKEQFSFDD